MYVYIYIYIARFSFRIHMCVRSPRCRRFEASTNGEERVCLTIAESGKRVHPSRGSPLPREFGGVLLGQSITIRRTGFRVGLYKIFFYF